MNKDYWIIWYNQNLLSNIWNNFLYKNKNNIRIYDLFLILIKAEIIFRFELFYIIIK